jgi:hypothetical protein
MDIAGAFLQSYLQTIILSYHYSSGIQIPFPRKWQRGMRDPSDIPNFQELNGIEYDGGIA